MYVAKAVYVAKLWLTGAVLAMLATLVPTSANAHPHWDLNFTHVYRTSRSLSAGQTYVVETRNLVKRSSSQPPAADTVLYILDGDRIVARNDDWNGFASLVTFTPSVSKYYVILVRSYSTGTLGYFDLYVNNSRVAARQPFGGFRLHSRWKSDECFETTYTTGDPYLYVITRDGVGGRIYRNDDGGPGLNSRICMAGTVEPNGTGLTFFGSYSGASEGTGRIDLKYHTYPGLLSHW